MSFDTAFLPLLMTMVVVSFVTRAGGFWLMRYLPSNPAVDAAFKATPLAVMVGIVTPAAARGSWPEIVALAAIGLAMRFTENDLAAMLVGVATVALIRHLGY
ncbi:MAG: hypothetical protein Kilf2KO_21290 [Rhodospirillales bacterium]